MLFNEYPYLNLTDINLDWIVAMIKKLRNDIDDFVNINTIKYADPFIWDITRQYEMNTVVVAGLDGTAYISVRPVPVGVAISNSDYWTVIFNYGQSIDDLKSTIAYNEGSGTTATKAMTTGELVYVLGSLYKVTSDMAVGTAYVPGGNVTEYTVAQYLMDLVAAVSAEAAARDAADAALGDRIDAETQAREDADTAEAAAREAADAALGDRIDAEAAARYAADAALGDRIDAETQAREDAIDSIITNLYIVTPQDFGAVGDGVADDTAAVAEAFTHSYVHIPKGSYKITARLFIRSDVTITADMGATLVCSFTDTSLIKVTGQNVVIRDLTMTGTNDPDNGSEYNHAIYLAEPTGVTIENCTFDAFTGDGLYMGADGGSHPQHTKIIDCKFNNCGRNGISIIQNGDFLIDGCSIFNTSGKDPQKAIDIEPNNDDSIIIGTITNCITSGNKNGFMQIFINHTLTAFDLLIDSCISIEDSTRETGRPNISFRNDISGAQGTVTISNMVMRKCRNTALAITGTSQYFTLTADITVYNMLSTYGVEYWARGGSGATQGYCDITFRQLAASSYYTTLVKTSGVSAINNLQITYDGTKIPVHEANDGHKVILRYLTKDFTVDGTMTAAGVITSTGEQTAAKSATGVYVISGVDHVKSVVANVTGSSGGYCTTDISSSTVTIRTFSTAGAAADLPTAFSIRMQQVTAGWKQSTNKINTYLL